MLQGKGKGTLVVRDRQPAGDVSHKPNSMLPLLPAMLRSQLLSITVLH